MASTAISLGGNTFQFFTRNPRGCKAKPIDKQDIEKFNIFCTENNINTFLAHAPYTLNFCSAKPEIRTFAISTLKDDLSIMENTPHQMYNIHPGSHVGQGSEIGISYIAHALNECLYEDMTTTLLLETMAGKGSEVGKTFEELAQIIRQVNLKDKIGICLDTCHVWDGGYDIKNDLDGVLENFDNIIGLEKLKAIHINDSKNDISTHKDRHEKIGKGYIGLEAFINIINHPKLKDLPFFLETPQDNIKGYGEEIKLLKSNYR